MITIEYEVSTGAFIVVGDGKFLGKDANPMEVFLLCLDVMAFHAMRPEEFAEYRQKCQRHCN